MNTVKFFIEWLVEQVKTQVRWLLGTGLIMALAFGANAVFPKVFHRSETPVASLDARKEAIKKVDLADAAVRGSRDPSSIAKPIADETVNSHGYSFSEGIRNQNSLQSISPSSQYSSLSSSGSRARYYETYSAEPQSRKGSSDAPKSSSLDSKPGTTGTTMLGGSFAPTTPKLVDGGSGSGSRGYDPSSGSIPSAFAASAGFQSVSGARICTAPNMQVRISIGTTVDPGVQTAPGMIFVSGIEGIYYAH